MVKGLHIRILASIILMTISLFMSGQNQWSDHEKTEESPFNKTFIKLSPLALFHVEPSIMIGVEYSATPKIRLQHEIGYVSLFNPMYYAFRGDLDVVVQSKGYRICSAIKIPIVDGPIETKHTYSYYGVDMMFKYLQVTEPNARVDRMGGSYTQLMEVNTYKYVGTVNVIYGINHYFNKEKTNVFDWWIGVGFRYKYVHGDIPPGAELDDYIPAYDRLDGLIMGLTGGLKLGIGI